MKNIQHHCFAPLEWTTQQKLPQEQDMWGHKEHLNDGP